MTTIETHAPKEVGICFGKDSSDWRSTPEYNMMFLKNQENYFNDILSIHGFVEKNEILKALGYSSSIDNVGIYWELKNGHLKFTNTVRDDAHIDIVITQV